MATRLGAYESVMRARGLAPPGNVAAERPAEPVRPCSQPPGQGTPYACQQGNRTVVPAVKEAVAADPVLSGLISFG